MLLASQCAFLSIYSANLQLNVLKLQILLLLCVFSHHTFNQNGATLELVIQFRNLLLPFFHFQSVTQSNLQIPSVFSILTSSTLISFLLITYFDQSNIILTPVSLKCTYNDLFGTAAVSTIYEIKSILLTMFSKLPTSPVIVLSTCLHLSDPALLNILV